ncbi:MAG: TonB-dependent receptor [Bacteroidia bacterium]|nr:TonB-dependent receptor [Bacteroidia bacterium]
MQGLDSQYTLILVDGVPLVGRSAGTLDIRRLTVGNIKQIEIVKGASSSLYGSEALGGVINIITENPKKTGITGDLNYRFATFNAQDINTSINYKKEKFSLGAYLNRNSSDGYDLINAVDVNTVDPYTNYTFSTKLNFDLNNNTNLFASGRIYTEDQDYTPTSEESGEIKVNEWNTHLKLDHKYNKKWSSYFEFYATRYIAEEYLNSVADNSLVSESDYDELLMRPEIRATYNPNDKSTFIGGIGMDHEVLERTDFTTKPIFNSPYVFLQYDTNPNEKLNVILGARFDSHSDYESQFSPKAAVRYELSDKIALKGSVGYGFKAPDFRQLYFNFTNAFGGYTILGYNTVETELAQLIEDGVVNENGVLVPISAFQGNLKPENSIAYNFGFNYKPISTLNLDLNLFRNDIQDLIDTQRIANKVSGNGVYSYTNVNKAYTYGLEFNASWKPNNQLKLSGGYQYLIARDKDAVDAFKNGEAFASISGQGSIELNEDDYFGLPNRSKHMANLKVFYDFEGIDLNTNIRGTYRSKYGLYDTNGTVNGYLDKYDDFVDAYSTWDWAINKTFYKNYELGFGVENIFDFTDLPESDADAIYIGNIPGRIIYGKLNITF